MLASVVLGPMLGCHSGAPSPQQSQDRLVGDTVASAAAPASGGPGVAASEAPSATTPPPFAGPVRVTGEARAMGTHVAYAAFTTPELDEARVRTLFDAANAEIRRLEALMTTWKADSEISRVNAAAGAEPVEVSPDTFDVVREALHASQISDGTFDITFEVLHGLWKFDQDLDPHPPTAAEVRDHLRYLGWRHVKLDEAKHTVFLDESHVRINLGGIAKGFAVDKAAAVLAAGGLTSFYVQAGGDLYARGTKPGGAPWSAGIRDPRGAEGDYFAAMPLTDHAFSTAGDYERTYVIAGKRYHHIIDPRTGYPATASRSVTIYAPTALVADEIDDAVFILGPKKGLALVESLDGVGAVIVDAQNHVWISKRLEGVVHLVHTPTDGI